MSLTDVAQAGRSILQRALTGVALGQGQAQGQAQGQEKELVLTVDHVVAARDEAAHGLLSLRRGAVVRLVEGDVMRGLAHPYEDYVKVRTGDGKVGKVSKFVVRERGAMPGKSARTLVPHDAVLE